MWYANESSNWAFSTAPNKARKKDNEAEEDNLDRAMFLMVRASVRKSYDLNDSLDIFKASQGWFYRFKQ